MAGTVVPLMTQNRAKHVNDDFCELVRQLLMQSTVCEKRAAVQWEHEERRGTNLNFVAVAHAKTQIA